MSEVKSQVLDSWLDHGYGSILYTFKDTEVCVTLKSSSGSSPQKGYEHTTCTLINKTCDSSCALQAAKEKVFDSFYAFLVGEVYTFSRM